MEAEEKTEIKTTDNNTTDTTGLSYKEHQRQRQIIKTAYTWHLPATSTLWTAEEENHFSNCHFQCIGSGQKGVGLCH